MADETKTTVTPAVAAKATAVNPKDVGGVNVIDAKSAEGKNFLSDPAIWAKRGNKIIHGDVMSLRPDTRLNVRFRGGSSFLGIEFKKDTLDIPSMKQGIVDGDGIHEPILVSRREVEIDGKTEIQLVPLRGNRRTFAGQELASDPATPEALRKTLTTMTPMIILQHLTPEQEQELVNDQVSKRFLKSEIVRQIIGIRRGGWNFEKIAMLLWEQMGQFSGGAGLKKMAEVRELTDPTLKREKIKTWLRGTLDNYLLWAIDLGPWMQKQVLLSEMRLDGVLTSDMEQPYFYTDVNSQKRVAALKKAKEADGDKYSPLMLVEGTEFKKQADEFHNIDFGNKTTTEAVKTTKMMDKKTIEELLKSATSRTYKSVLVRVLGQESLSYTANDEVAAIFETKQMLVDQFLPRLKPEMKAIIRQVFVNPDPTDFQKFLEEHSEVETGSVGVGTPPGNATPVDSTFSLTDNAKNDA